MGSLNEGADVWARYEQEVREGSESNIWEAAEFSEEEIDVDEASDGEGPEDDEYEEDSSSPTMVHGGSVEPKGASQRRGKRSLLSHLSHVEIPTYSKARVEAFWRAFVRDFRERLKYAQTLGEGAVAEEWEAIDLWAEKHHVRNVRRMVRALLDGRGGVRLPSNGLRDARDGRKEWVEEVDQGVDGVDGEDGEEQVEEINGETEMKNLAGDVYQDELDLDAEDGYDDWDSHDGFTMDDLEAAGREAEIFIEGQKLSKEAGKRDCEPL